MLVIYIQDTTLLSITLYLDSYTDFASWLAAGQDKEKDVVRKNVYDAFVGTDLEKRLRRDEVERVVIVGVMSGSESTRLLFETC